MMRKKHDKRRRVHECQTFGELRGENRLNSNDERNIMMNKTS
jgi:hypothetical protein